MKFLSIILTSLFLNPVLGQVGTHYSSFSSAFQNIDSVRVISINCMHNNEFESDGCDSLPNGIDKLYNLTALYISESGITSLPNSINRLRHLKELSLDYLFRFNYDAELCKLQGLDSLEYLGLWMGRITNLPTCITTLKSLKSINLSNNANLNIENAFKILMQLPHLQALDLSGIDNLTVIPKDVGEIVNLTSLRLDYLRDRFDYKTSFERLLSLKIKFLSLNNNWLKILPESITNLKQLEFIDLSNNSFTTLPHEISELTNLREIKIQNNNNTLTTLTGDISRLTKLEKINFGSNWKLNGKQVVASLSTLQNLKDLDMFGCRLDTIADEIMNFPALERLDLTFNPTLDFPDLFRKLSYIKTLRYLNISDNKLITLPKEIGRLTLLEHLVIGQNAISSLPEEFFQLTNLKTLNVYGTSHRISREVLQQIQGRLPNCKVINQWVFRH